MKFILAIDQSKQGTKAMLLDEQAKVLPAVSLPHRQIILDNGYVEHDPEEIYANVIKLASMAVEEAGIRKEDILAIGLCNQRETSLAWDRKTGKCFGNAVVWQCARGEAICREIEDRGLAETIRRKTGLRLSPYFSAAKIAWILRNRQDAQEAAARGDFLAGTVDSYLLYRLTHGEQFRTDVSNASRTQLMNLETLDWDEEVCGYFGLKPEMLPEICASDSLFGMTDLEGTFPAPIPVHAMLGDSHASLFGHGCRKAGQMKSSYGTGSSIMMNIGEKPVLSEQGLVTSLAWKIGGKTMYVLEGNVNYSGAVMTWAIKDLGLLASPSEADELIAQASPEDTTYIVPAFSGLGAPYWESGAKAMIYGMSRSTGRAEIVRAVDECIVYQVTDIVKIMEEESGYPVAQVSADGGGSKGRFLMQFQSDMLNVPVNASRNPELSATGAGYAAGLGLGLYDESVFENRDYESYAPQISEEERARKMNGWKDAVRRVLL